MTTFWTVLVLTYTIDGWEHQSRILLPSMAACGAAMDPIHETMEDYYDDTMSQCLESDVLSATIRPKARPQETN